MNRRSALALLGAALLAPLARLSPSPRPLTFTVAGTPPPPRYVVVLEGTDAHGRPVREEVDVPDDGSEILSTHSYRDYSITVRSACCADPTVAIGYGPRYAG